MPSSLQARTSVLPRLGQAGAGIGRAGEAEGHAGREGVGAAPDDAQRAKAVVVEGGRSSRAGSIASAPSKWRTAATRSACRRTPASRRRRGRPSASVRDPASIRKRSVHDGVGHLLRVVRGRAAAAAAGRSRHRTAAGRSRGTEWTIRRRRHADGEKAAGKSAFERPRQIDVAARRFARRRSAAHLRAGRWRATSVSLCPSNTGIRGTSRRHAGVARGQIRRPPRAGSIPSRMRSSAIV